MTGRPAAPADGADVDGTRPMRADAVKNRRRILEAAEQTFAAEGVSVPVDVVAERAGVGVGTVYRHFPTKEALFEAIVLTRLDQLLDTARSYEQADDPAEALFAFLRAFAGQATAKRDLFEALGSAGIDIKSGCATKIDEMRASTDRLLARARAGGRVRSDLSADEVIGLVVGVCHSGDQAGCDEDAVARMVDVVCDGLRVRA